MESTDNFAYLLPFIFFIFGCTFVVAARWGGISYRWWGAGYIAAALGFSTPILLSSLPDVLGNLVSNACFLISFFSYGQAVLSRFGRPAMRWPLILLALAGFAVIAYFIVVAPDLRSELTAGDICLALLLLFPLWAIRREARHPMDRLLAFMLFMVFVETVVRVSSFVVLTSSGTYPTLDAYFSSEYAFVVQAGASVIGFILALTILCSAMIDIILQHRDAAERDALTDLLNRRGFERAVPDFGRGETPAGAVLACDIDHFKLINDRFGHAAGDAVIVAMAQALRSGLPKGAAITRFGGEEFIAFLPDAALSDAAALAEALCRTIEQHAGARSGIDQTVTASFGVSLVARGDHSVHDAIGRADASLYAAKAGGRNQVVVEGKREMAGPIPALRIIPKP
ncbi:GGDEF domain-containing protein [Neorhizobium alkalisoli]|uniref:diguanylate cyclase n=1 Tax=Neorhizobium alkalisoli TaxID=528178 RepID=A0A561QIN4_9HYPH|nr:GGDEF domain-containing protein [Neorhizobium alkalisoli]TWF50206.1 diguanylate cyclase (GGDEF)-like protein [Neorhizobium alkalisoli]